MIGSVRLLLALVATALVACPVMASDMQHRGNGATVERAEAGLSATSCHDVSELDLTPPGNMDDPCPDPGDCRIAVISQIAEVSVVTPLLSMPDLVAVPLAEIAVGEAGIIKLATGPPPRALGTGMLTPLILKQRLLI
jgi:hypothetical protein